MRRFRLLPLLALACSPIPPATSAPVVAPPAQPDPPPPVFPEPPPDPEAFAKAPRASPRLLDEGLADLAKRAATAADVPARAHVSTDKPLYRPGETVWVRSWHLATATFASSPNGGVVYELVGPRGDVVAENLVEVRGGAATNDLVIPTEAPGGAWTVRIRTPDGTSAERRIVVLGYEAPRIKKSLEFVRKAYVPGDLVAATLKVEGPTGEPLSDHPVTGLVRIDGKDLDKVEVTTNSAGEALVRFPLPEGLAEGDGLLTVLVDESGVTESISRRIPILLAGARMAVYPEGGRLVEGLPSRVYFAATKADGKPADVTGRVVDDRGEVVTGFRSFHHGLGRFELTPRPGRTYHLEVRGEEGTTPIPAAEADGCVLRSLDDFASKEAAIRVDVRCSTPREVTVVGTLRGKAIDAARVKAPRARAATVYLATDDTALATAPGVARVTVYDDSERPLAERLVMRNPRRQLAVEVKARGGTHGPRDRVTLDVITKDPSGRPVAADLAVAVVDDTVLSYADDKQGDIVTRLLVEAELPTLVEEPRTFFAETSGYALDLLMGTSGWRTFARVPATGRSRAAKVEEEKPVPERFAAKQEAPKAAAKEAEDPAAPRANPVVDTPAPRARDAKMSARRVPSDRQVMDRAVAENAGVLGALQPRDLDLALGNEPVRTGMGGLVGGGGTAEGLGGLGTRGRGGGSYSAAKVTGVIDTVQGEPIVLGALDRSLIDAVVKRNLLQVRYCYQRELTKNPALAGKLTIKFVIAKDGTVSSAVVKSSTLDNRAVEACVTGRFLRFQFAEPKGGGIVIVSYPFLFRSVGKGPDAPLFDTVRVFPEPTHLSGGPRTDFRDTVGWVPVVRTNEKGRATVSVTLSDAVTSFRAIAEGVGGGLPGRGDAVIASTLPFSMAVKLPVAAVRGDRLSVPLTLSNDRDTPVAVTVGAALGQPSRAVTLPPRSGRTLFYDLLPTAAGPVSFTATSDGLADAFTRALDVMDAGFPREWSASGRLDGRASAEIDLTGAIEGTAEAWLKLYPNPLASMVDGLEGLLRVPHGCFEQTSATNYPNLLVLRYLEEAGVADAALAERARGLLEQGYARLTSYEVQGGGYEWFGRSPAHESLTAYGLAEFADMRAVFPGVDEGMLRRTAGWLTGRRDGRGGWRRDPKSLDGFGGASDAVANAYITWSLLGAGMGRGLDVEIDAQARLARETDDAYLLALATDTLLRSRPAEGRAAAKRLARLQDEDGAWRGADHSITRSTGRNLHIETTALATLALLRDGAHAGEVESAVRWLMEARDGSGRWGSTQATILTLKALTASGRSVPRAGAARVRVDGADVTNITWRADASAPVRVDLPVGIGRHTIALEGLDGGPIPYTFGASWSTRAPPSDSDATVGVQVSLASDRVDMGETVRLVARVRNLRPDGQPMAVARIGIPAGLTTQTWQLDELRNTGVVDFYETRPNEVTVYFRTLAPGETREIPVDLLATVPGEYVAPASRAYLYYADDAVAWAAPVRVAVSGG